MTDYLGNTRAEITDKKIQQSIGMVTVDSYTADQVSAYYYSAYGAISDKSAPAPVNAFNGQRMSPELGEFAQTAQFWEYNGDVGRRWNIDPRPNGAKSPYSCFNNNPGNFTDVLGDTAVIKVNKNTEIAYVGKKWINAKTREQVISEKMPSKIQKQMADYSKLNEISEFDEVSTKINNSPVKVLLNSTKNNTSVDAKNYLTGATGNTLNVYLSTKSNVIPGEENYGGMKLKLPSYIALGHELGHVFDVLNGKPESFFQDKTQIIQGLLARVLYTVSRSEINATYWENILRIHGSLPVRTKYGSHKNPNVYILDNETLKYYQERTEKGFKIVKKEIFDLDGRSKEVK